jgi:hypothetical protein
MQKSNRTFWSLIENMFPQFQKTTSHQQYVSVIFFPRKRNQKPLAFEQHGHWSETSLKLTCHQRKTSLSFFRPLFSSMKRSLMRTRVYHTHTHTGTHTRAHTIITHTHTHTHTHTQKSLEFLLRLFKKLHPKKVHKTSHFTKTQNLKIAELSICRNRLCGSIRNHCLLIWENYKSLWFTNNYYV